MIGEVPAEILNSILEDAGRLEAVAADAIEVIRAEAVVWNDGSLDCPERGVFYTQATVDGYQVVVRAAGRELDYRVGSGGEFRLCEGLRPSGRSSTIRRA